MPTAAAKQSFSVLVARRTPVGMVAPISAAWI